MPTPRPRLLTIGTSRLRVRGLTVRHAPTLLDGYAQAMFLLAGRERREPTLILLNLAAHEPGCSELAAPQVAAVLTARMQAGLIHPAWLLGLASQPTPELEAEAQLGGCQMLLRAPVNDEQRQSLVHLAVTPPLIPPADRAMLAYQRAAERVLTAVQAVHHPLWTSEDVQLLLSAATRYPLPRDLKDHSEALAQAKRIVRAVGGPRAARARLQAIAEAWRPRSPLRAEILGLFLAGWVRNEIVRSFVDRDLYENSRIYACINELPERIAQELRLAQGQGDKI